jgi:hypothetical protein
VPKSLKLTPPVRLSECNFMCMLYVKQFHPSWFNDPVNVMWPV